MHRSIRLTLATLLLPALLVACAGLSTPTPGPATVATPAPTSSGELAAGEPRPIVITTDMGMDDLLAVYVLLRDPAVEVRAITVDGTGLVHCGPGLRNLRRILVAFGRPEIPFACSRDDAGPDGVPFPEDWRATSDNMYGVVLPPVVGTEFPPEATDLLADAMRTSTSPVTVVALGPWTVLEDLFAPHPDVLGQVDGIHSMGGAIDVPGNMEAAGIAPSDGVEWNIGADPGSVAAVLALDVPVTFVPLDATNDVPVPSDIVGTLESDHAAAGADIALETYARSPFLTEPGNYLWDATAVVAMSDPTLATWEDTQVSIDARGRISRDPSGRPVRIATGADGQRTVDAILGGLRRGAPRPEPFSTTGTVKVTWDGTRCAITPPSPTAAGSARIELVNRSNAPVGVFAAGVVPPHTWADVLEFVRTADLAAPTFVLPDWIIELAGDGLFVEAGATASMLTTLPAAEVGFICATGDWPSLTLSDAGSITLPN
jgi:inosine-uridine nucleoside N-ribohydrolase